MTALSLHAEPPGGWNWNVLFLAGMALQLIVDLAQLYTAVNA